MLIVALTEHNLFAKEVAQTSSYDEDAMQLRAHMGFSREEYLLKLIIKESPDFHKQFLECILQPSFCIIHIRIMRCINKVQKDILEFHNTVKTSILVTSSSKSVLKYNTTLMSLSPVCSLPSSCSSDLIISHCSNFMTHQVQPVLNHFRNYLSDKPTILQLVEDVIPLQVPPQWKTLGSLLGVPVHQLESIEKSYSFQVKDCCYDMFR